MDSESESKDICAICHDELDETTISLKCNHKFHYDCILLIYKNPQGGKYKNIRMCPYCRSDGGYLPIKENVIPIQYIHREYEDVRKFYSTGNYEYIEKYLNKNKCWALLQSGKNKGCQCSKNPQSNSKFCKIHSKK